MEILSPQVDLDSFFTHITKTQERLLLLDYDGTLAPFRVERDQAFPYPGVTELLSDIRNSRTTRIIIISGRAIQDIVPLIDIDPLPEIWGSHGWEYLSGDGEYKIIYPDEATINTISQAKKCISLLNLENHCEQKPVSLAIHWRGLTPERAESIETQIIDHWTKLLEKSSLEIHPFDGGIELRVVGKDKGTAVNSIIDGLDEKVAIAYLGDDFTDEDAFKVLKTKGLNVLVREQFRPTNADLWIKPPGELLEFLSRWKKACLALS